MIIISNILKKNVIISSLLQVNEGGHYPMLMGCKACGVVEGLINF